MESPSNNLEFQKKDLLSDIFNACYKICLFIHIKVTKFNRNAN